MYKSNCGNALDQHITERHSHTLQSTIPVTNDNESKADERQNKGINT